MGFKWLYRIFGFPGLGKAPRAGRREGIMGGDIGAGLARARSLLTPVAKGLPRPLSVARRMPVADRIWE
jgi:hypothetical protein